MNEQIKKENNIDRINPQKRIKTHSKEEEEEKVSNIIDISKV